MWLIGGEVKGIVRIVWQGGRFVVAEDGDEGRSLSQLALQAKFRVDALAKLIGVSDRQLRSLFTEALGMAPKSWMQLERMVQARLLLAEGRSVAEVSEQLGFTPGSNFARDFQEFHEVSPTDFQRKTASHRLPRMS